jgi:hypothetical protein
MDCLNRWTTLVEASRTSTDRLPRMSGGATNPVGAVETCGEENEVTIVAVVPGRNDLQRRIERQPTISPSIAVVPNQPNGVPPNMTVARSPPFPSMRNDGAWVPYQLPPRTVAPTFQQSPPIYGFPVFHRNKRQRTVSPSISAVPNQPNGVPPNMTVARSPPFPSVNDGAWVPYQLVPPRTVAPSFQHSPPIYGFPQMLYTRHQSS